MPQPRGLDHAEHHFAGIALDRLLGRGENGEVFAGVTPRGEPCVVKMLADTTLQDGDRIHRMEVAVREISRLGIEGVHGGELVREGARAAIRTVFIDGETLADRLARVGALAWADAHEIALGIGRRLAEIHRHDIVFGGLRATNVLLARETDEVHLVDVGLSRNGLTVGGISTAAPEQLSGGVPGPATDIYALAALTHHMVTGEPVFPGTPQQVQLMHRFKEPRPVTQISPGAEIPASIEAAILRGLEKDPQRRPHSVAVLLEGVRVAGDGARREESATMVAPLRRPTGSPVEGDADACGSETTMVGLRARAATTSAPEADATTSARGSLSPSGATPEPSRDEEAPTGVFSRSTMRELVGSTKQGIRPSPSRAGLSVPVSPSRAPPRPPPPPPPTPRGRGFTRRPAADGPSATHQGLEGRLVRPPAALASEAPSSAKHQSEASHGVVSEPMAPLPTGLLSTTHSAPAPAPTAPCSASPVARADALQPPSASREHQAEMTVILPPLKSLGLGGARSTASEIDLSPPHLTPSDEAVPRTVVTPMRRAVGSSTPATATKPVEAAQVEPRHSGAPAEPPIDKTVVSYAQGVAPAPNSTVTERTASPLSRERGTTQRPPSSGQTEVIRIQRPPEGRIAEETMRVPGFGGEEIAGAAAALAQRSAAARVVARGEDARGEDARGAVAKSVSSAPASTGRRSLRRRGRKSYFSFDRVLRIFEVIPRALGQLWRRMIQPFSRLQTLRTRLSMPLSSLRSSMTRFTRLWSRWRS